MYKRGGNHMEVNPYLLKLICITKSMEGLALFDEANRLSRTEFRLIREVLMEREKGNEIISSELARRLGITRSAVSQIVTKLEARNIVLREDSPTDRKIAYIRLSDHALAVFERQCEFANGVIESVVEKIGVEKMNGLIEGYDEFANILSKTRMECEHK